LSQAYKMSEAKMGQEKREGFFFMSIH